MSNHPIFVAPSVLAADFARLEADCDRVVQAGADWLHLDVMDGHFVDNISFGPPVIESIAKFAKVPLDTHLMVEHPEKYYPRISALVQNITIHVESSCDVGDTLKGIRKSGCTAGLAISPPTNFNVVLSHLDSIDLLLVMTVNPGFGGQAFIVETMEKVRRARQLRAERNLSFHIEVDGGISAKTSTVAVAAGANVLVAGTSIFRAEDPAGVISSLRPV